MGRSLAHRACPPCARMRRDRPSARRRTERTAEYLSAAGMLWRSGSNAQMCVWDAGRRKGWALKCTIRSQVREGKAHPNASRCSFGCVGSQQGGAGCDRNRRRLHFKNVFTTQKYLSKSFRRGFRKAFQELSRSFLLVQCWYKTAGGNLRSLFCTNKKLLESSWIALR